MVNQKRLRLARSRLRPVSETEFLLYQLLWGRVKSGKTRYIATGPRPIMFMAERGDETVRTHPNLMVFPLGKGGRHIKPKWDHAWDFLYLLKYGDTGARTVGVDTTTAIISIAMKKILRDEEDRDEFREPGVPDQRTWGRMGTTIREWIEELETICKTQGMHLILTAQQRERNFKDEDGDDYSMLVPDLPPSLTSFITQRPNIVSKTIIETEEGEEPEEDEEGNPEDVYRYGQIFRDPYLTVGERITDMFQEEPLLPTVAFNVTIPKLLKRIERSTSGTNQTTPPKRKRRKKEKASR